MCSVQSRLHNSAHLCLEGRHGVLGLPVQERFQFVHVVVERSTELLCVTGGLGGELFEVFVGAVAGGEEVRGGVGGGLVDLVDGGGARGGRLVAGLRDGDVELGEQVAECLRALTGLFCRGGYDPVELRRRVVLEPLEDRADCLERLVLRPLEILERVTNAGRVLALVGLRLLLHEKSSGWRAPAHVRRSS